MWNFDKTSTNNLNWTLGKLGAGYIHARTNTPDSFSLLDYSIRTWNIGPDHTDDIDREIRRKRPVDTVVFEFYITPTGGIHDAGRGFKNRTSRPDSAVIDFLHRKDNRLYNAQSDVKAERLSDDLKNFVSSIEPRHSHSLTWVKGGKGRGLMLNDGKLITWPVNKKGEPQHADMYEYLTNTKLPESHSIQDFVEGSPFDIYEDGTLAFFSDGVPAELMADLSKIDYRLKTSAANPQELAQQLEQLEAEDQAPRKEYEKLMEQMGGNQYWQEAKAEWDKTHDPNDPFGDAPRRAKAQELIKNNIEAIQQDPNALHNAWLLVQHMDPDPEFQKWFINYLDPNAKTEHGGQNDYQYLMDRIQVGMGVPQTYGTQTGSPGVEGDEWNSMSAFYTSNTKKEFTKEDAIELLEKNDWDYDANEFWMGMNDELEHDWLTHGNPETTAHIVSDHLKEHPDYYSRLHKTFSKKIAKHYPGFATHFHPYTGQECNCHYGQSGRGPVLGRVASQAVRKVKNQDQKHLRSESGQAILDYLHKLISGHSINEQGEFGQGEYPGIEGMVPWVVKQLKTGWLKPFIDDDGSVANMGQLDSYYQNPESVKAILSKRAALPIDVEGMSNLNGVQESYGKNGYKFVTGQIDNPDVKIIYINNYGEGNLDPATIQSIIAARPDAHVFVSEEDRNVADVLREQYQDNPLIDISNSIHAMRFIQNLVDQFPIEVPTDYSIEIPYTFYNNVPWNSWSDWFNATNAPAREGKDIMKMNPLEVTNSAREHQDYLRELREMEELKGRFADTKDENIVYRIQDPKYKGWTVKQIASREDAELESEVLGHCIGSEDQNYAYNIAEGNIMAFSLRDEHGIPKLTWHYNPDGTLAHIQGKSNDSYEMFRPLVTEFNNEKGFDDDNGESGSEDQLEAEEEENLIDEVQLPEVDNVEDYVYQYHEDGDGKWELAGQIADDEGGTLAEDVSIYEGDVDWETVTEDLFKNYNLGENDTDDFFSTIMQSSWSMNEFAKFADIYVNNWEAEEYDAGGELVEVHEEPPMFEYYRQWRNVHTNPKTGQLEEPRYLGGGSQQESFMERHKEELENPWSFMPQWSELKTITGEPAVGESGYARPAYLPVSQDPRYRDVAMEGSEPCENCEGTGQVRMRSSDNEMMPCYECNGTGVKPKPITIGPNRQRVLEDPSGQMYFGKLTVKEKAEAWDKPASKLSKTQAKYVNGEL